MCSPNRAVSFRRCKPRPHRYRLQSAPRPRLAEGFPELNPARPMLGFRPRSGSQTGFLTDDFLFAARAKVVADVFGSTERMINANEENVGPIAARTRFPC